jgi:dodecin
MEIDEAYSPFGRGLTIGSWRPDTGQTEGGFGRRITVQSLTKIARPRPVDKANPQGSRRKAMPQSVYKVIELIGTSTTSWEEAAKAAVERAAESLRDLRVAEVVSQDLVITDGKVEAYRAKVKVSFKYEGHH